MGERSVIHNTFVIERSYPVLLQRVFAAFADPARKRRWFTEGEEVEVELFEMDFRVGGREHVQARLKEGTPFPGIALTSDGSYQDIVADRRIVMASAMALGEKCISASLITVEFYPTHAGTDLILTHQGAFFEGADGPQMRAEGWHKLLARLETELTG